MEVEQVQTDLEPYCRQENKPSRGSSVRAHIWRTSNKMTKAEQNKQLKFLYQRMLNPQP